MISKDMYRFLKHIPRWHKSKPLDDGIKIPFMNKFLSFRLQADATCRKYIAYNGTEEQNNIGYYLTEEGCEAVEEYARNQSTARLSKIAIVLSVIGLLISLASFLGWGVQ